MPYSRRSRTPLRRKLLDRLNRRDGQTLGQLCERIEMTRFGVMKHLRVLESAGLIVTQRVGREKQHYLNRVPIRRIHDRWVSHYTEPMAAALSRLKTALEDSMSDTKLVYEIVIHTTRRNSGAHSPSRNSLASISMAPRSAPS